MNPIVITHALIQAVLVKRRTERMPEAAGLHGWIDGHEHDPAMDSQPLRLVLLGDSSAAGLGVDHNLEGMAGQTALQLAQRRGTPVSWEVRALGGLTAGELVDYVVHAPMDYADVVVIAVGVNDTKNLHTRKRWRRELGGLFDLVAESAPKAEIVYLAMPRLELFPLLPHPLGEVLGRRAKQMGEVSAGLAERHPRVRRVELTISPDPSLFARDGFHPGAGLYAIFGEEIAAALD
ncbi:MAG: SGNH/GDSL hydrolase family protein [Marmoricola sp.]|jgi:lysophospholipase L1-like esterase